MARVTLSVSTTCDLDGNSAPLAFTCPTECSDLMEITKDVSTTPVKFTIGSNYSWVAVINTGDEEFIIEVNLGSGNFAIFDVPIGMHIVIPSTINNIAGDPVNLSDMKAYTATGSSRMLAFVAINAF